MLDDTPVEKGNVVGTSGAGAAYFCPRVDRGDGLDNSKNSFR
ncbi:hypothetical protein [Natronorarus salvus]